jgi:AcrR family transcriptional regulator
MDAGTCILEAADELFAEVGFDATTTREIATRAGVNEALIHYHYEGRDELDFLVAHRNRSAEWSCPASPTAA